MSSRILIMRSLGASTLVFGFFCVRPLLDRAEARSSHFQNYLLLMFCFCVLSVPVVLLIGRRRKAELPFWYVALLTGMSVGAMNLAVQAVRIFTR